MPNPNTLSWLHYQDIQIDDASIKRQFVQRMSNGDYAGALQLLNNNASKLQGKAYVSEMLSTISSGILALEDKFQTGIISVLEQYAQQFQAYVNSIVSRGTWSVTFQYEANNFVYYNDELYFAIARPPMGTSPDNEQYWLLINTKGQKGAPGIDVVVKYNWNSEQTYQPNDVVVYDGILYAALKENKNITPGTDETAWVIFLSYVSGDIEVGTELPQSPYIGQIFFLTKVDPYTQSGNNAVSGSFMRYLPTREWDPMYPDTVFTLVSGISSCKSQIQYTDLVEIKSNEWTLDEQYGYRYNTPLTTIGANDSIKIFFQPNINKPTDEIKMAYQTYSKLNLDIDGSNKVWLLIDKIPSNSTYIKYYIQ